MGWFSKLGSSSSRKASKKKKKRKSSSGRSPRHNLAPVEEIVEQGLLVADVAVRMTVKNAIIMNALKEHADYDEEQIIGMVRDSLEELASERERDSRHISRVREEVKKRGRSSWSETVYGTNDSRTLRHRQEVYAGVAVELRKRIEDEKYLAETAERARTLAWREIGDSLKERASHPYYSGGHDAEYQNHREERIQQLIEKDLTSLIKQSAPRGGFKKLVRSKSSSKSAPASD